MVHNIHLCMAAGTRMLGLLLALFGFYVVFVGVALGSLYLGGFMSLVPLVAGITVWAMARPIARAVVRGLD